MPVKIDLLGSTGSIGTQTLDIISRFPEKFRVGILAGGNNVDLLIKQSGQFNPDTVVISNKKHYLKLKESLSGTGIKVLAGEDASAQAVALSDSTIVLAAIVGYSGLKPTIAAIRSGKVIALANKETLVVAGEIITRLAKKYGSRLIPVDSEHSAIFQCLAGEEKDHVEQITLTASGGPFLFTPFDKLKEVSRKDALQHPNWNMGEKVTIDSASMMNKGLEVIEAKWLFDLDAGQIKVIIHPQSIIHSFVHFKDGSVKAQLGMPDMRLPILYALSYPERFHSDLPRLDLNRYPSFSFSEPDLRKFKSLSLAYLALKEGGNKPCAMNAANEMAVNAFLNEKIGFLDIPEVIEHTLEYTKYIASPGLDSLESTDREARIVAENFIKKISYKK